MADYTGAAGAFYYMIGGRKYLLVGKESRYVRDYINLPVGANNEARIIVNPETGERFTSDTLRDYETYEVAAGTTMFKVHAEFTRRARALTRLNHITIRYDLPRVARVRQDGTTVYKAHYRMLFEVPATADEPLRPIQYGVVKGGREPSDVNALHTLQRELLEETGITMNINHQHHARRYDTFVYYVNLTGRDITRLKEQIAGKNRSSYGELFRLTFMDVDRLSDEHVNAITHYVIKHLR